MTPHPGSVFLPDPAPARHNTDPVPARKNTDPGPARHNTDPVAARHNTDPVPARKNTDPARHNCDPQIDPAPAPPAGLVKFIIWVLIFFIYPFREIQIDN